MLGNLEGQLVLAIVGGQGVENSGKLISVELDVNDGTCITVRKCNK
jgi:hypothetical protein